MLIDFRQLFPKYNIKPKGVLHVGANVGEEMSVYHELGISKVIWIEGNPELFFKLKDNIRPYREKGVYTKAFNMIVGDEHGKECDFNISNNGSQSSSILELGTHKTAHPEVHYTHTLKMKMERIDQSQFTTVPRYWEGLDFLNMDIQGAELKALKGMGDLLHQFKWAYLEVNKEELYKGCALVGEIDAYLSGFGFKRVETRWCGNTGWGDAIFIKNYEGSTNNPL